MDNDKTCVIMKAIINILTMAAILLIMAGCKTKYVPIETVNTDSTFHQVTDTVIVRVRVADYSYTLPQTTIERETKDTISILRDSLYESIARIRDGLLFHSLSTIPGARVNLSANVTDTIKTKTDTSYTGQTKTVYVPYEVERDLTWWQKVWLWLFYPLIIIAVAVIAYIIIRIKK